MVVKDLFVVLLGLLGVPLFVMAVAPLTRRCRDRLEAWEGRTGAAAARILPRAGAPPEPPPRPVVPPDEKTGFHVSRFLTRDGVLGLFFSLIVVLFAILNSRILAECFEVLRDRAGLPLGVWHVAGLQIEVTDVHLYGFCLSLAQILIGAAFASAYEQGSRWQWAALLGALVPLVLFETVVAGFRGAAMALEGDAHPLITPPLLATLNALQAYVCAVTEACAGYFAIHCALVPLLQAIAWLVVAPFRWMARAAARLTRLEPRARPEPDPTRPILPVRLATYFDEGIVEPLRAVDRWVGAASSRIRFMKEARHVP